VATIPEPFFLSSNGSTEKAVPSADWLSSFLPSSPSFQRCVIPVQGFYEWLNKGGTKLPVTLLLSTRRLSIFLQLADRLASALHDLVALYPQPISFLFQLTRFECL
jgi:hypothetical protein